MPVRSNLGILIIYPVCLSFFSFFSSCKNSGTASNLIDDSKMIVYTSDRNVLNIIDVNTYTITETIAINIPGHPEITSSNVCLSTDKRHLIFNGFSNGDPYIHYLLSYNFVTEHYESVFRTGFESIPDPELIAAQKPEDPGLIYFYCAQGGLAKFDEQTWTVFNKSNSGLTYDNVSSIAIDEIGNKWIGTFVGLSIFNENGVILTDVKENKTVKPDNFSLTQNYPNPFNPSTAISFSLPEGRNVKLIVFDQLGREITTLVNEYISAGSYNVQFNASSLPSGVYIYTIQAGDFRESKKLLLLK